MSIIIFPYLVSRQSALLPLAEEEFEAILLFKEKALKLGHARNNQNQLPIAKFTIDKSSERVISFESNIPDIEKIENIALKFRFFFADKEPTHIYKILNLLSKKSTDQWAKNYIARVRLLHKTFLERADTSEKFGHPVKNDEIINLWFNSDIFHQDKVKREKLDEINNVLGQEASLFQLNTALRMCTNNIESIYRMIHKTDKDHQFIYTPSHHFENDLKGHSSRPTKAGG